MIIKVKLVYNRENVILITIEELIVLVFNGYKEYPVCEQKHDRENDAMKGG